MNPVDFISYEPYYGNDNRIDDKQASVDREVAEKNRGRNNHYEDSCTRSSSTSPSSDSEGEPIDVIARPLLEMQERKYPPLSMNDTAVFKDREIVSPHSTHILFTDDEIVEKSFIVRMETIGKIKKVAGTNLKDIHLFKKTIYAQYTEHGKAFIHQQSTHACIGTIVAMLCMDKGVKPDISLVETKIFGNEKRVLQLIRDAGFTGEQKKAKNLSSLKDAIRDYYCAIVSTKADLTPFIIVDDISEDLSKVRIRDPYHGWEISVTGEAFQSQWTPGKIILMPLGG